MATHKAVHVAAAECASDPRRRRDHTARPGPRSHRRRGLRRVRNRPRILTRGFPGLTWPLTLGHEIAGTVAEIGDGVEDFAVGDRVAVGWFGGNCNRACRVAGATSCSA